MDNEIELLQASSDIKDANLKTLARMVIDYNNDCENKVHDLAKALNDWDAMVELSKSILKDTE
jgi:hypothetical protein